MDPIKPNITLSQDEFESFFLIYASHIDYEFSEAERLFILNLYPEEIFQKMLKLFENTPDYNCLQLLLKHKKYYFDSEEKQKRLYAMLQDLFEIDGEFSRMEKNFVPFFQKMIELNTNES